MKGKRTTNCRVKGCPRPLASTYLESYRLPCPWHAGQHDMFRLLVSMKVLEPIGERKFWTWMTALQQAQSELWKIEDKEARNEG